MKAGTMTSLMELQERVWECNMALFTKGLVIYTFGNVSGFDKDRGIVAIKPSGVPYRDLTKEHIVLIDLDSNIVKGNLSPSSDTTTHLALYRTFPQIGGIAHTHSPYATAWSQAKKAIPCFGTTHADYVEGDILCTQDLTEDQIRGEYELETGNQIIKALSRYSPTQTQMILVGGHAPFTWGENPEKALQNSVLLEEIAKLALLTLNVNPDATSISKTLISKHYQRKHGSRAYYGQNTELQRRSR
jgi:L-ribulose-5-phosphate 4-epimerase